MFEEIYFLRCRVIFARQMRLFPNTTTLIKPSAADECPSAKTRDRAKIYILARPRGRS